MKLRVGDIVQITTTPSYDMPYKFVDDMKVFCGKLAYINNIRVVRTNNMYSIAYKLLCLSKNELCEDIGYLNFSIEMFQAYSNGASDDNELIPLNGTTQFFTNREGAERYV